MDYSQHFNTVKTPQTQPIPGKAMIENRAGGYVFTINSWQQFRRFLILGTEGGTYYAKESEMTKENAQNTLACIQQDTPKAISEILDVSVGGLAPKNDPAIFALALACAFAPAEHRKLAYDAIINVCRTGTHLFTFCQNIKNLRGWSRGLRTGVAKYYKKPNLEYQLIKYRQRNGWTHKDVLRLCHAKGEQNIMKWAVGKSCELTNYPLITAYEMISKMDKPTPEAIELTKKLPWEAIPTEFLKDKKVWEALLPTMPLMALMRNLNKLSVYAGVDSNLSEHSKFIADQFNEENIKKNRLHPLKILEALKIYSQGHGLKGNMTWTPVPRIMDALNEAFYLGFKAVEPTGKRFVLGLDVSGSMGMQIGGSYLTCAEASAALCMTIARTEKEFAFLAFADQLRQLPISPSMTLPEVLRLTTHQNFGSTDCSVPMMVALNNKLNVDVFQIITDNETYHGNVHPVQALQAYRNKFVKDAKLVVWGMTATKCSIADPNDPGMLDVAGFDTSIPEVIRNFVK